MAEILKLLYNIPNMVLNIITLGGFICTVFGIVFPIKELKKATKNKIIVITLLLVMFFGFLSFLRSKLIEMPNLIDMTLSDAIATLNEKKIKYEIINQENILDNKDWVVSWQSVDKDVIILIDEKINIGIKENEGSSDNGSLIDINGDHNNVNSNIIYGNGTINNTTNSFNNNN